MLGSLLNQLEKIFLDYSIVSWSLTLSEQATFIMTAQISRANTKTYYSVFYSYITFLNFASVHWNNVSSTGVQGIFLCALSVSVCLVLNNVNWNSLVEYINTLKLLIAINKEHKG